MKIALVQFAPIISPPLGLLSLGTHVKKYGHKPIILDLGPHEPTTNYFEETAKKIINCQPEALGFSVMDVPLPTTLLVAEQCKKIAPHIPIILGGPEVSFDEISILEAFKQIDIIVRGEGEETLLELLNALEKHIPLDNILGITYNKNGKIIRNEERPLINDLDQLPIPDYSLLKDINKYKSIHIEAGRGCPYNCTFCSTCKMWKNRFRIKSPERLIREIEHTYKIFKTRIYLLHDHLLANQKWNDKFLSLISKKGISWTCSTRLDALNEILIKKLSKAGCCGVFIGIESASSRLQKRIKKYLDIDQLPKIIHNLTKNYLPFSFSFVIGLPSESAADLNHTLMTALKTKLYTSLNIQVSYLTFDKGSQIYYEMKKKHASSNMKKQEITPFLDGLRQEQFLIRKYPDLFMSLFILKATRINPVLLQKISVIFALLCNYFPGTIMYLLKALSLSPYNICKTIVSKLDKNKIGYRSAFSTNNPLEICPPFLSMLIHNLPKIFQLTATEVLMHEQLLIRGFFSDKTKLPNRKSIKPKDHPILVRGTCIIKYKHDPVKTINSLKKKIIKYHGKTKYIAYVPGNTPVATSIDPFAFSFLPLCNGKNSIQDIFKQINKKRKNKISFKSVITNISFFHQKGILYFI